MMIQQIEVSLRDGRSRDARTRTATSWQQVLDLIGNLRIVGIHVRGNRVLVYARYGEG